MTMSLKKLLSVLEPDDLLITHQTKDCELQQLSLNLDPKDLLIFFSKMTLLVS